MAYSRLNNRGWIFEKCLVFLILKLPSIWCYDKLVLFHAEPNKACGSSQLNLKPNETFSVWLYSTGCLLNARSSNESAIESFYLRNQANDSALLERFNSQNFNTNKELTYKVQFKDHPNVLCTLKINITDTEDPDGTQGEKSYLALCVALGALLLTVFIVETILIFHYRKKYISASRRKVGSKEDQSSTKKTNRYSSPPERKRGLEKIKRTSEIYEEIKMNEVVKAPTSSTSPGGTVSRIRQRLPTPPVTDSQTLLPIPVSTLWRKKPKLPILQIAESQKLIPSTNTRDALARKRPRLPTPPVTESQAPIPPAKPGSTLSRTRTQPPIPLVTESQSVHQHSENSLRKTGPRLPIPRQITADDEYEEMDKDLVLNSKMSALATAATKPNIVQSQKIQSELCKILEKRREPLERETRPHPAKELHQKGFLVPPHTSRPRPPKKLHADEVAPPVPNTPRPRREDLIGSTREKPRPDKPDTGNYSKDDNSTLSSDDEWDTYDELGNHNIYNV